MAQDEQADPILFSSEQWYEFPFLIDNVYVGRLIVFAPGADNGPGMTVVGEYAAGGFESHGGIINEAFDRVGGFASSSSRHSIVQLRSERVNARYLRTNDLGGSRWYPIDSEAAMTFGDDVAEHNSLDSGRALHRIQEYVRDRGEQK
jgi:hypothetical protein